MNLLIIIIRGTRAWSGGGRDLILLVSRPFVGSPLNIPCCALLKGLANLEAVVCLCTALKAKVVGINLSFPVDLSLLLNYCGKKLPYGFQCA